MDVMTNCRDPGAGRTGQPLLRVRGLSMSFGAARVLDEVCLDVPPRETLVILGDSGCGKTTFLRILAGLLAPTEGEVFLEDRSLAGVPPRLRGIVYLDQEALLFEHLDA